MSQNQEIETVRVVVRVRPMSKKELIENHQQVVHTERDNSVIVLSKPKTIDKATTFTFNRIFTEDSTQLEIYKYAAFPIVEKVLKGYNGTIFAYGQTGTGKTYTMLGFEKRQMQGIIPNTFNHIFTQIHRAHQNKAFIVTVTYLEIYNEDVRDLLSSNPTKKLEVRERFDIGVYVKNLMGFTVDSIDSVTKLMKRGNRNRITRSTMMNDVSSRSHAIFTINIESKDSKNGKTCIGKLNLVDLAGSERISRTGATGERLKEAGSINQSLSVLGNVITALVDAKSTHIPYRNSKLTRLLQDSLGGNSKTVLIAMVSPSEFDFDESICTLRYARRVKHIKNKTFKNVEVKAGLIERFQEKIDKLRAKIVQLESQTLLGNKLCEETQIRLGSKRNKDGSMLGNDSVLGNRLPPGDNLFLVSRDNIQDELKKNQQQKEELLEKIRMIQSKILVGGEHLLEKAQEQEFLLDWSEEQIDNLDKSHLELEETLQRWGSERFHVEYKYSCLQDENEALDVEIDRLSQLIREANDEMMEQKEDHIKEVENLLLNSHQLNKELSLANHLIDNYIPKSFVREIEKHINWNKEIADYQLQGIAHTGNNISSIDLESKEDIAPLVKGIKAKYHTYANWKYRMVSASRQRGFK